MKLFYSKGACSLGIRIIINELGIPCEYEAVDLATKKTETSKDFLSINPKGSVPVLQISEQEFLTENTAIQQYLADKHESHPLLPPAYDFKRYRVLEWLSFISTDVHKSFAALFNPKVPQTLKDEIFLPLLKSKFKLVDKHLKDHAYLVGDEFTLPDAYLFVVTGWLKYFNIDVSEWPNLAAYIDRLKTRSSIVKSLKEEEG